MISTTVSHLVIGYNDLKWQDLGADNPLHKYTEIRLAAQTHRPGLDAATPHLQPQADRTSRRVNLNEVVESIDKMLRRL